MLKWHTYSAIGRSRPLANDFQKAFDGIAVSLRQFHISASSAAEDSGNSPKISRAQRSATAAAELSSLSPRRGIDARSMAATPSLGFKISRVDFGSRNELVGRSDSRGGRGGRGSTGMRGRGAGGMGGRGSGRGRGRGGNRGGSSRARTVMSAEEELENEPEVRTPEHQAYLDGLVQGVQEPCRAGTTTLEDLLLHVPTAATLRPVPIGTLRNHMRTISGQHKTESLPSEAHTHSSRGKQAQILSVKKEEKDLTEEQRINSVTQKLRFMKKGERELFLQTLSAPGQYQIKAPTQGDTLGAVENFTTRNETYLSKDIRTLVAKVQDLLPVLKVVAPRKKMQSGSAQIS